MWNKCVFAKFIVRILCFVWFIYSQICDRGGSIHFKKRIQPRINGGWDFNHMSPFKTIGVKKKLNLETSDPLLDLPQIRRGQLKSKNLSQKVQHIFQTNKTHFEKKTYRKLQIEQQKPPQIAKRSLWSWCVPIIFRQYSFSSLNFASISST